MTTELVSYKQQINTAHKHCIEAKAKGGAYAHECGTWLAKQREEVVEGKWVKWIRDNCDFDQATAYDYLSVAEMDVVRARNLSTRDCLKEAVDKKTETRILKEFDNKTKEIRNARVAAHRGKSAEEKAAELQRDREIAKAHEDRERIVADELKRGKLAQAEALEVVTAGYRVRASELHPDKGGDHAAMSRLNLVKGILTKLINQHINWR